MTQHSGKTRSLALRRSAFAGAACLVVVTVASCTSSGSSGGSSPTASRATSLSAASIATIAAATSSKPGKADSSLSPVTWGYVNQEGGAITYPLYTLQVKALVAAINTQLGGIGGHPLRLTTCLVQSDEDGQRCGQQFVNDKNITAILQFPLVAGDTSFHRVIDPTGIPVFGPGADTPLDAAAKTDFFTSGSRFSTVSIIADYAATKLHAKTAAVIGVEGNPISTIVSTELRTTLEKAGVSVDLAQVSPTSTDVTSALVASGVSKADVILTPLSDSRLCTNVAKGLKTLNVTSTPVIGIAQCANASLKAALGDYPTWSYVGQFPNPDATPLDAREASQVAVTTDLQSVTGSPVDGMAYTPPSLQATLTALTVVNRAGGAAATRQSIVAAAKKFAGPLFLGPDSIAWGAVPTMPAVPTLDQRIYAYEGKGVWKDVAGGWYAPPAR